METVGSYRIVKELGRGAMGVVFEAFDPAIGRTVALKLIRSQPLSTREEDAQLKLRFSREASAAGRLSHPNIVTIYQLGEHDGMQYLVMEYITGVSLESMLVSAGRLSLDTTLGILTQIAAALDYAHAAGVVHRDIKPANILVMPGGTVKLTDFGIARITSQTMTQTGFTMGTPAYMAPEQVMAARVDGRADQYSLAVVAYQMLAGKRPFEAPTDQALLFKIVSETPRRVDEVNTLLPKTAAEVIGRGLAKDPGQRYQDCAEFVAGLRVAGAPSIPAQLQASAPVPVSPAAVDAQRTAQVAPSPPAAPLLRRRWPLVAAGVLLASAAAVWFSSSGAKAPRKQDHAAMIPVPTPATDSNPAPSQPAPVEPPPKRQLAPAADSPPGPSPELRRSTMAALDMMTDGSAPGDTGNRPIQLIGLTSALNKGGAALTPEIGVAVKRRGVNFRLDPQSRAVLVQSGATDSLLDVVGTSYHPPAGTLPPAPAPVAPPEPVKLALQAGATRVNEKDGLKYVWIPPGTFQMGCSTGDAECIDAEKPAHPVTLTRGFWIGQTPVTQEAYRRVVGNNPSQFKGDKLPVETVNWNEAQGYCQAAGMRLPTEAEWEYAARAGTTGSRYGDLDRIGWYVGNSGNTTHAVGQKEANAFGLYDMLGNVWQWVGDWYAEYQAGSQRDPAGPAGGLYRVLRGGSWYGDPGDARASYRYGDVPGYRNGVIGLRCAGN